MRTLKLALLSGTLSVGLAHAQEPKKPAPAPAPAGKKEAAKGADPSGTWTWSMTTPDGQTRERKITLKREGDKLTGSTTGRDGAEQPIDPGTFKDGQVAFTVTRERNGNKFVSKYTGKVEGDLIKGSMTMNRGGEERTVPWEAKRAK